MPHVNITVLFSLISLIALTNVGCVNKLPSATTTNNTAASVQSRPSQPDNQQIETEIRSIVAKVLNIEPPAVDVSSPLSRQKAPADELDVVEIVMMIEETMGIEIKDEEVTDEKGEIGEDLSVKKLAEIASRKKTRK